LPLSDPLPRHCIPVVAQIVYDVTSRQTFDELLKWMKEIDTFCGEGVVKMVVGNKVDKVSAIPLIERRNPWC
jgi:GTPase SAR1 family protein